MRVEIVNLRFEVWLDCHESLGRLLDPTSTQQLVIPFVTQNVELLLSNRHNPELFSFMGLHVLQVESSAK